MSSKARLPVEAFRNRRFFQRTTLARASKTKRVLRIQISEQIAKNPAQTRFPFFSVIAVAQKSDRAPNAEIAAIHRELSTTTSSVAAWRVILIPQLYWRSVKSRCRGLGPIANRERAGAGNPPSIPTCPPTAGL